MIAFDQTFVPKFQIPTAKDYKAIRDDLEKPEKDRVITWNRASNLPGCPYMAAQKKDDDTDELDFTDDSKRHFILGHAGHAEREWINKNTGGHVVSAEQEITVVYKEKGTVVAALKGTPDVRKVDFRGLYIEDYKGILLKAGTLKDFYMKQKDFPDPKVVKQISIYNYMLYVLDGVDCRHCVITYFDKLNPRNRLSGEAETLSLAETERFVIGHPLFQPGHPDIMDARTKAYMGENGWNCDDRWCAVHREGQCPYTQGAKKPVASKHGVVG